ncbi:MAG: HEAT repeat domain-containing protein, partial [Maioricimonas sp. JB049]
MLTLMVVSAAVASGNGEAANGQSPPVTSRDFDPPLWSDQQETDFRKHRLNFSRALKVDRLTEQDRQNITRGVQRYMYRLTMPTLFRDLPKDVLREIIADLRSPVTSGAARDFMMQEIIRIAPELFNQPLPPRFNLAILLANLNTDHRAEPLVPYLPAADPLLAMLQQPNQFFAVKIWCAKGLGRICRDADPNIRLRDRIADALLKGLAEAPDHVETEVREWYQRLFIEALGDTGLVYNINRQPTIIDTLMQLLTDPQKSWDIRTAALHAVSRLQFEPSTNVDLILYEAAKLAEEMGRAYNQNRGTTHWPDNFLKLY